MWGIAMYALIWQRGNLLISLMSLNLIELELSPFWYFSGACPLSPSFDHVPFDIFRYATYLGRGLLSRVDDEVRACVA